MRSIHRSALRTLLSLLLTVQFTLQPLRFGYPQRVIRADPNLRQATIHVFENTYEPMPPSPICAQDMNPQTGMIDPGIANVKINHWAIPESVPLEFDEDGELILDPSDDHLILVTSDTEMKTGPNGQLTYGFDHIYSSGYFNIIEVAGTLIQTDLSNFGPDGPLSDYGPYSGCPGFEGYSIFQSPSSIDVWLAYDLIPTGVYVYQGGVFHDINQNGFQDNGESGISGVQIEFWGSLDGIFEPTQDEFLGYAVTDATGYFSFIPDVYYYLAFAHVSDSNTFLSQGFMPTESGTQPIITGLSPIIQTHFGYFQQFTPTPILPTPIPKTSTPAVPPFMTVTPPAPIDK